MAANPLKSVPGPYEDTTCQMVVAYGNPYHPHLQKIREFRDEILMDNSLGRKAVELYYSTTSIAVPLVAKSSFLRQLTLYAIAAPAYLISCSVLKLTHK